MSAFGAKRKARKITVQEDDDNAPTPSSDAPPAADFVQEPPLQASFKSRKPAKHSSLRRSINLSEPDTAIDSARAQSNDAGDDDEEDGGAPLRVRPSLGGRANSNTKAKKRASSSRLSFGPSVGPGDGEDEDSMLLGEDPLPFTPKKSNNLAATASENSAYKKGITKNSRLPLRSMEADDDRPRYSKEYLSELQSSTPNTPANLKSLPGADDNDVDMSLDPSELDGATVVENTTAAPAAVPEPSQTVVLTEAEILERKARRARLGAQNKVEDFISLDDDGAGDRARGAGESYLSVLSRRQNQPATQSTISSKEKRLVKDDNLDEDDSFFVEDGGLSLGKKAERAARRKKRADMAAMIATAEGADGDETRDDSEAERRAAYESAQTRAGMDGLAEEREQQRRRLGKREGAAFQVPAKITPLPDLSVLVEDFKAKMARKELELKRMQARIRELTLEKEGIEKREPEVQKLLDDAGERYKALMGHGDVGAAQDGANGTGAGGGSIAVAQSLLEKARPADTPGRGLESLGATPVRTEQMEL